MINLNFTWQVLKYLSTGNWPLIRQLFLTHTIGAVISGVLVSHYLFFLQVSSFNCSILIRKHGSIFVEDGQTLLGCGSGVVQGWSVLVCANVFLVCVCVQGGPLMPRQASITSVTSSQDAPARPRHSVPGKVREFRCHRPRRFHYPSSSVL